ncbi:hypothetical protein [Krasilnikovia sp. M28-CT-15]|uniref:hypothetical protein n=1 Tax=Krasilnikovia sp. M28-CT-15 TaxID=3373540 RepID=UPI00399C610A
MKASETVGKATRGARRNARDHERLPEHAEAHLLWSAITLMTRRLTRAEKQNAALPTILAA